MWGIKGRTGRGNGKTVNKGCMCGPGSTISQSNGVQIKMVNLFSKRKGKL